MISFIIPTRRASEALRLCLDSLISGSVYKNQLLPIVDSPSWQTIKMLQEDYNMTVSQDFYFTNYEHIDRNMDYGIRYAKNDYVCITCDDMVFSKGWDRAVMEAMDGRKNRIVSTVYYTGPTGSFLPMDFEKIKNEYLESDRKGRINFDMDLFNSMAPAPDKHVPMSGSPPFMVFHKDVYKLANGLDYFATQGQAFELVFLARAIMFGCDHIITKEAIAAHFGQFANGDNQRMAPLPWCQGVFECSVCGHIDLSEGNVEYPRMNLIEGKMETAGGSERGRLTAKTGLFLCERCKKNGWTINIDKCKLQKK